ncbi:MAG: hypothetical protein LBK28_02680, partial [Propionibacteriaceae bacterium]|nr:hypothetical protein [Propionibacteriaceae bacterium]
MALRADLQDITRTYVWTALGETQVVGYYSISPTQVAAADLPRKVGGGHSLIPGFLLGRLALDVSIQHLGLGRQLLVDALETLAGAALLSGGRVVVVDPIDASASKFYQRHHFLPTGAGTRL